MTHSKPVLVAATAFMILLCVVFAAVAGFSHATGYLVMAVFGVYTATGVGYALVTRWPARRPTPERFTTGHVRSGQPALVAPTPAATVAVALSAVVVSALAAVALLLLTPWGGPVPILLAIFIGALPMATLLRALRGRLHRGHVAMAPHEVELQTWTSGVVVPWDEIAEIRVSNRSRNPTFVMLLLDDRDTADSAVRTWHPASRMWQTALPAWEPVHRAATITVEHAGLHPDTVLALLHHYWSRPDQRSELATAAALHRLQQHQLQLPTPARREPDQPSTPQPPDRSGTSEHTPAGNESEAASSPQESRQHGHSTARPSPGGHILAGLAGLGFVTATVLLPPAAPRALATDSGATVTGAATILITVLGLYAGALAVVHTLLRLARLPHPGSMLLLAGAITIALGGGYLALLALALPAGAQLSPLWPAFALGILIFSLCARGQPARWSLARRG